MKMTSSPAHLKPDQHAGAVVRAILSGLCTSLRRSVDLTINNSGPDPLHDLRVATRRTRSALSQLGGVLPAEAVPTFAADFKWLGEITGRCRDLDVWLLDLSARRDDLAVGEATALSTFESEVRAARDRAHAEVVLGLTSPRCRRLLESWETFHFKQAATAETPQGADTPVKVFADGRITRAYQRVLHRGRDLGGDSPPEALHRLRIAAKNLRYLLEFFRSLYPAERVDPRITELKGLQDVLGELNDRQIQRANLAVFTRGLEGIVGAGILAVMSDLGSDLEHRQRELRRTFRDHFDPIVSAAAQLEYRALVCAGD
jgi:CHAD domain-containing protein